MSKPDIETEVKFGDSAEKVLNWIAEKLETTDDKIILARGWCKRCGICIAFCPVKALDRDNEGCPVVDNDKCISCGTCELMCPDYALTVTGLKSKTKRKQ